MNNIYMIYGRQIAPNTNVLTQQASICRDVIYYSYLRRKTPMGVYIPCPPTENIEAIFGSLQQTVAQVLEMFVLDYAVIPWYNDTQRQLGLHMQPRSIVKNDAVYWLTTALLREHARCCFTRFDNVVDVVRPALGSAQLMFEVLRPFYRPYAHYSAFLRMLDRGEINAESVQSGFLELHMTARWSSRVF